MDVTQARIEVHTAHRAWRLVLFAVLAALGFGATLLLDGPVYQLYRTGGPRIRPPFQQLFHAVGLVGFWLLIALGFLVVDVWRRRRIGRENVWRRARVLLVPVLLAGLSGEVLKVVIRRERPLEHGTYVFRPWGQGWDNAAGLALPSTHACVAFAGALALLRLHRRAGLVLIVAAVACSVTRIQVQAHFLSDVYLGAVVGLVAERLVNRRRVPRPPPAPVPAEGGDDARLTMKWMTWRATVLLAVGVLAIRILYLALLCPYELWGDEAYYWECGRHPDWCYYEKTPGIATLIGLSTRLCGDAEWSVRLPVAVCSALATLALARLAMACSRGDARVGFLAALAFTLMPAYQGNAQIATQDGPLVALWILASWAAWWLFKRLQSNPPAAPSLAGRGIAVPCLVLGAVLGLGFLFKQSMLLIVPGWLLYALLRRQHIRWDHRLAVGVVLAALVFAVVISPVVIWNQQHGWPTLRHTLGHLGAPGGDRAPDSRPVAYDPFWMAGLLLAQIGAFGPAMIVLMVQATLRAVRARARKANAWSAQLLMLCCALPSLAFYIALTTWKKAEANWPFPSFAPLLVLVAQLGVSELPRHKRLVLEWLRDPRRPRPRRGVIRRRPETLFQVGWDWVVIYGVAGWLLFSFAPFFARTTLAANYVPADAFRQQHIRAARVQVLRAETAARTAQEPLVVAAHYMDAAWLNFYLPDRPLVFNAQRYFGSRPSSYDYWPATDLRSAALRGRPAILVGKNLEQWGRTLEFDELQPGDATIPACIGSGYRGPPTRHSEGRSATPNDGVRDSAR
jgi:hypothetical protein